MKKILCIVLLFLTFNVYAKTEVKLDKCVDGDTAWFIKDSKSLKFRFLAIDTPETVHPTKNNTSFGKTASNYTCNSLKNANIIEIEYDPNSTITDKYNRELVWVFVDNKLLQLDLIENGYAKVEYIYGKYMYLDMLIEKENEAKNEKKGIWGKIYTVNFVYNDIVNKVEVIENSTIEPITLKDNESIIWYLDDKPFDFNTKINSNIELVGKNKNNSIKFILIILFFIALYFIDKGKFKKLVRKVNKKLI